MRCRYSTSPFRSFMSFVFAGSILVGGLVFVGIKTGHIETSDLVPSGLGEVVEGIQGRVETIGEFVDGVSPEKLDAILEQARERNEQLQRLAENASPYGM